jgi:hypothetical protein
MMALSLSTSVSPDGADSYGVLNLYSDSIDPFGPNEYSIANALAAQISIALAAHREIRGRGIGMTSRTIIGQAEGILMERLGIYADHAFAYLRRVSQSENRKLIMICSEIVKTRRLPQCSPGNRLSSQASSLRTGRSWTPPYIHGPGHAGRAIDGRPACYS